MNLLLLRAKFDSILGQLNLHPTVGFCGKVEAAFEALTMAHVMREYARIHNGVININHPRYPHFLNQKPGKFTTFRAFEVTFNGGHEYYFATDVEVWGLKAMETRRPIGIKFEADVVVIRKEYAQEIHKDFNDYPAPHHLDCVCECKFGEYNKGQLRELLGLRRHISYLRGTQSISILEPSALYYEQVNNAFPVIPVFMTRPRNLTFFDKETASMYDLKQVVIN